MQYSTALSDAFLAAACLAAIIGIARAAPRLGHNAPPLLLGFLLPLLAAACGVVRFGISPSIAPLHVAFSQASGLLGLPLLGLAAFSLSRGLSGDWRPWSAIVVALGIGAALASHFGVLGSYRILLNLLPLLLLIEAALRQRPRIAPLAAACTGVGLFLGAGLAVGTDGFIGPLRRIDLFHALLTLAYGLLAWLLLQLRAAAKVESTVKTL
ncbi:hypothetical protein JQX08_11950 [Pseudomonas sp. UL073]|uniref:DUF1109 domain-containing protein n=1 Tax=Zestomonas insulae TaxID=2809017 RepID=A0ABS2IGY1_9GAMM|nr:hypothetical protein [Pseudomonas insulae]MBM7061418.1 hypothetical protein [Pseudomonas insulae]